MGTYKISLEVLVQRGAVLTLRWEPIWEGATRLLPILYLDYVQMEGAACYY
jgi:hypothetical protein